MTTTITPEQIENTELLKTPKPLENPKNNVAVFKDGISKETMALDRGTAPVRTELATLHGLQSMKPTDERTQKIFDLERQRGRMARFALLQK